MTKIQDTQSSLPDLDTTKLMKAFSWVAVMLLGLSFGAFLGGILFSSLLAFLISGSDAALLAYFVLPLTVYYFLNLPLEMTTKNDLLRRYVLFSFAAFEVIFIVRTNRNGIDIQSSIRLIIVKGKVKTT